MKDINEFVLYCKGWYTRTADVTNDIYKLLSKTPQYNYFTKTDMIPLIMRKWSHWNDTLPEGVKLTISDFWRNINHELDILHVNGKPDKIFNELSLDVIIQHIRYIDPKYLELDKPIYKKGKARVWFWHEGMTYKQLNKYADERF